MMESVMGPGGAMPTRARPDMTAALTSTQGLQAAREADPGAPARVVAEPLALEQDSARGIEAEVTTYVEDPLSSRKGDAAVLADYVRSELSRQSVDPAEPARSDETSGASARAEQMQQVYQPSAIDRDPAATQFSMIV